MQDRTLTSLLLSLLYSCRTLTTKRIPGPLRPLSLPHRNCSQAAFPPPGWEEVDICQFGCGNLTFYQIKHHCSFTMSGLLVNPPVSKSACTLGSPGRLCKTLWCRDPIPEEFNGLSGECCGCLVLFIMLSGQFRYAIRRECQCFSTSTKKRIFFLKRGVNVRPRLCWCRQRTSHSDSELTAKYL